MGGCIRRIHFEDWVKTTLNQRAKCRVPRVSEFPGCSVSFHLSMSLMLFMYSPRVFPFWDRQIGRGVIEYHMKIQTRKHHSLNQISGGISMKHVLGRASRISCLRKFSRRKMLDSVSSWADS